MCWENQGRKMLKTGIQKIGYKYEGVTVVKGEVC